MREEAVVQKYEILGKVTINVDSVCPKCSQSEKRILDVDVTEDGCGTVKYTCWGCGEESTLKVTKENLRRELPPENAPPHFLCLLWYVCVHLRLID
jgi:hypothetical protein